MIDRTTFSWFIGLPAAVIQAPGVLRIYLTPYTEQVAAVLEANRYRDRRRVKRELRKMHERLFARPLPSEDIGVEQNHDLNP